MKNEKKDTEINILFVHRNYGSRMHTHKEGEMQQMKKAFQEHQSEVYKTVATCITDIFDVQEYGEKQFTAGFIDALRILSEKFSETIPCDSPSLKLNKLSSVDTVIFAPSVPASAPITRYRLWINFQVPT